MLLFDSGPALAGAACKDLPEADKEVFFATSGGGHKRAKAICRDCPVRNRCLEKAMDFERGYEYRFGVWGGMGAKERKRLERSWLQRWDGETLQPAET